MGEMCTMNTDAAAEKHGQMQENVHDVMQLMNEYNDERSAKSPMFRVFLPVCKAGYEYHNFQ